jgi:signal transduction histidine kinase
VNPHPHRRPKGKHRKQILLFGISVLLPALVLLFFTLRMNRQDRELRIRRAQEAKIQKAEEIGRHLVTRLEKTENILIQELAADPSRLENIPLSQYQLVFLGPIIDGDLRMPWEAKHPDYPNTKGTQSEALIQQAQRAEFSMRNLPRAKALYDRALLSATSPSQKSFIRLQLGRILSSLNDNEAALKIYSDVLAQPSDVIDEYGIPLCLFAGERLSSLDGKEITVMERLSDLLKENSLLPPAALYLILDITEKLKTKAMDSDPIDGTRSIEKTAEDRLENVKKILSLKPYVKGWISSRQSRFEINEGGYWQASGEIPWIIGIREIPATDTQYLFAFHGPDAFNLVLEEDHLLETFPGSCSIKPLSQNGGFSLGSQFRDLQLQFSNNGVASWSSSSLPLPIFYWLILILVIGFTGFGMYLLWRDFRRELKLAELRSQFAASVSHELKTPLTAIRMYAEALTLGVRQKPEEQQDYLHTIINESERLSRLLNNVLDFSKIEQGTRTYTFQPTSPMEVIEAAEKAMAFPMHQKGFNIQIETGKDIPTIRADGDALEQAILNLLHNALKYSGDSRDIILKLYRTEREVCFEVEDYGIGISDQDINLIFSRFFRGPTSENQRIPGTGLGLTIVSHIAQAHNGRVEVDSQQGEGSIFTIILPLETG